MKLGESALLCTFFVIFLYSKTFPFQETLPVYISLVYGTVKQIYWYLFKKINHYCFCIGYRKTVS